MFIVQNDVLYEKWAVKKLYSEIQSVVKYLRLFEIIITQISEWIYADLNLTEYNFEGISQKMLHSAVDSKLLNYMLNILHLMLC